jgi:TrmH family RNA methyltransferase
LEVLTSLQNPKIKTWASLKERKYRKLYKSYLVEGLRSVEVYVEQSVPLEAILIDPYGHQTERAYELADLAEVAGVRIYEMESHLFKHITDTEHPQGIVAVAKIPEQDVSVLQPDSSGSGCQDVVVVADQIGDPGNLGTIIRSADAVNARAVVALKGSADLYQPKVVRTAMGSLARMPVFDLDAADALTTLAALGYRRLGADARRGESLFAANLSGPIAFFVGNETGGLSPDVEQSMEAFLALPMPGGAESLNAGVASSILLYEALRHRIDMN